MHATHLRVRLSETDQNGVVYYSQYFVYFDVAKSNLLSDEKVRFHWSRRARPRAEAESTHEEGLNKALSFLPSFNLSGGVVQSKRVDCSGSIYTKSR